MRSIRKIASVDMDYEPGGNAAQRAKGYAKRVANNKLRTINRAAEHYALTYETE